VVHSSYLRGQLQKSAVYALILIAGFLILAELGCGEVRTPPPEQIHVRQTVAASTQQVASAEPLSPPVYVGSPASTAPTKVPFRHTQSRALRKPRQAPLHHARPLAAVSRSSRKKDGKAPTSLVRASDLPDDLPRTSVVAAP
jgi:hypothetical protein